MRSRELLCNVLSKLTKNTHTGKTDAEGLDSGHALNLVSDAQ